MIQRIVLIKLQDEYATPDGRAAVAQKTRQVMPDVTGVERVHVGCPADETTGAAWDLSIVVQLANTEALEHYASDPAHRDLVDNFLSPLWAAVKAWNFEV